MAPSEKQEVTISFKVPPGYREDARLDVYLTEHIQNATRAKVQRGIKDGKVQVNQHIVRKSSHTVLAGDFIECVLVKEPPMEIRPEPIPLDVVFEDDYLIVVNKPAGMVVHPGYGNRTGTLVHALLYHVGATVLEVDSVNEEELSDDYVGLSVKNHGTTAEGNRVIRPGIVHRLDKDTSGVLVVAKTDKAHVGLAEQFAKRTIFRRYEAVVWGVPDQKEGRIESYLGRDPRDRRRITTVADDSGKHAITNYTCIQSFGYTSHLEFRLETGRTHQIRVHAQKTRHPIFGDPVYGGNRVCKGPQTGPRRAFFNRLFSVLPRQALHASTLGFTHPVTQEELRYSAPAPHDMAFVIDELQLHDQF